jgi:hypothetical protein
MRLWGLASCTGFLGAFLGVSFRRRRRERALLARLQAVAREVEERRAA